MRNFYRLAANVNVSSLMLAISTKPHLWNQNTHRRDAQIKIDGKTIKTPHANVDDIWLRMGDPATAGIDNRENINYPAMAELPEARKIINAVMADVGGERIGRCMITRLAPGMDIGPHTDIGDDLRIYYDNERYYSRFHVVLQGLPGSLFHCGDETVQMMTGEVWWFDNSVEHSVVNNSADDRIHMIIDIRVAK